MVIDAALDGLWMLLSLKTFMLFVIGMIVGLVIGFIPGLGGLATIALLIPVVYGMDAASAIALILGAYGAVSFGGSITAILTKTPGTGEQVVTTFDGYPMTQQGKGARALGISAAASALGGMFGVLILIITIPFARQLIIYMRPPEMFALALLGIAIMGIVNAQTFTKGILSGMIGLMLSFIGYDPITGVSRLTFGSIYLHDGLGITALTMGLFAVAEMFALYTKGTSIAGTESAHLSNKPGYGVLDGVMDVLRHWKLSIQCSIIGAIAGILPGMGATVAMFTAYGYAARISKHPERFGKGAPEGILGPESANNAKEGGSLVPTLAFGIPGSSGMALMIGVFLLLGYVPGPQMMNNNLDVVFLIAWTMALSNVFASFIGLGIAPILTKATFVRPSLVAPTLIAISMIGAFVDTRLSIALIITLIAGFVGYLFNILGYSNAGIILGFMLGPLIQKNLFLSMKAYGWSFFLRPVTLSVFLLGILLLIGPWIINLFRKKGDAAHAA